MIASALLYPLMLVFVAFSAFYLVSADFAAMQPNLLIIDLFNVLMDTSHFMRWDTGH